MKLEKREMTVRELGDYITMIIALILLLGFTIAPLLWLGGLI